MHEFTICEQVVKGVVAEMESRRTGRLLEVHVVVGAMHQLVPDFLHSAYEILSRGTAAEGSVLQLRESPVTVRCRECGWEGTIQIPFFQCGDCGSTAVDTLTGEELAIEWLRVEADSPREMTLENTG